MRCLALVWFIATGCSIGIDSHAPYAASPPVGSRHAAYVVTSEMLDRQNPAADTKNNKQLSRSEDAPPRDDALAGWTEVAAGAFQILLGR